MSSSSIDSLIAQKFLSQAVKQNATAIQRLSSGLRVNDSRDDAAGLAISARLDAQARAFDAFNRNANDAVSYMQVADGALSSISDNLLRMDELRVQASNSFLSNADREKLDKEYQQLVAENSRIIESTEYNGIKVFGAGKDSFTTRLGSETVTFDMKAALSIGGRGTKGALAEIFNTAGIGATPESLSISNPGIINFGSAATGTYAIQVNQLARGFIYRDTVGAGPFGNDANVTNSNPGVATYAGGPVGSYAVNVATVADNYVYQDNVGAGNPVRGIAAASFATTQSNPAVASITAADDSNAQYSLTVTSVARGQTNTIGGVAGTNGAADTSVLPGNQPSNNDFRITFGDGTQIDFSLANGTYTTAQYVTAFNTAAGGRVTASYNAGTQVLSYSQNGTGTNGSFAVENRSTTFVGGAFNAANVYETNAGNTTQTAANAQGNLNGQAFNSQTNNGITVNAAGDAGRTASFNVLTLGTTTFDQRQATQNRFNIAFGDGTAGFQLNLGPGTYNVQDFVNAFNASAAGSKFVASYNNATGLITYTGQEDGATETLQITNASTQIDDGVSGAYGVASVYDLNGGNVTQTGTNFTGDVNGTAFNSVGSNISAGGLNFNALSVGATNINVIAASTNVFRVDFGDGTSVNLNLAPGDYTANNFVSQFNAVAGGRFTAAYDGNAITYTSNVTGATVSQLTITNLGDAAGNVFELGDAATLQAGLDSTGTVNGVGYSNNTNVINAPGINFQAVSVGSTTVEYQEEILGELDARFDDIRTMTEARGEEEKIRVAMDAITSLRAKVGANISRLDGIVEQSKIAGQNYYEAMGRIIDADFAFETSRFTRSQILAESARSILNFTNLNGDRILDLLGTGLQSNN